MSKVRKKYKYRCFMCGDEMPKPDIEIKGTENDICDDCLNLSGCCGCEIINGFCSFCKEHV